MGISGALDELYTMIIAGLTSKVTESRRCKRAGVCAEADVRPVVVIDNYDSFTYNLCQASYLHFYRLSCKTCISHFQQGSCHGIHCSYIEGYMVDVGQPTIYH